MPFDGKDSTPALNRARLIEALRAPMPKNFRWEFEVIEEKHSCGTSGCAMGYAKALGLVTNAYDEEEIVTVFGVYHDQLRKIFYNEVDYDEELDCGASFYGVDDCAVKPAMVADALEKITVRRASY